MANPVRQFFPVGRCPSRDFGIHVAADILIHRRGERFEGSLNVMFARCSNGGFQDASLPIQKDLSLTQEQFDTASDRWHSHSPRRNRQQPE